MDHWSQRVSINHAILEKKKGMAALSKMSLTNAVWRRSEGCVLLGVEGGITRNERVLDKEMDEAKEER